jgi:Lar family restriction alleviation protein
MSEELKPCPFCGSEDVTLENLFCIDDWYVSCNKCDIQQIAKYKKDEAILRWNQRAEPAK